jgi:hypothetical protein
LAGSTNQAQNRTCRCLAPAARERERRRAPTMSVSTHRAGGRSRELVRDLAPAGDGERPLRMRRAWRSASGPRVRAAARVAPAGVGDALRRRVSAVRGPKRRWRRCRRAPPAPSRTQDR